MNRARAIALVLLLGALLTAGSAMRGHSPSSRERPALTGMLAAPERAYWLTQLQAVGPAAAYAEFKTAYAAAPFAQQHEAAHGMGILLYRSAGLNGITACDASFAFGCYHSFFGQAIATQGLGIVPELAEICKKEYGTNSTGCEHGIGHGILEYLGPARLVRALELCGETKQQNPLFGCTSGVFMEYNTPTLFDASGTPHTSLRAAGTDLYAPCDSIVSAFRSSCYFEIGAWWKNTLGSQYQKIGALCSSVPETENREACLKGWGTVVAELASYNPAGVQTICGTIAAESGRAACELGAAARLFGAGKEAAGKAVCEKLTGDFLRQCEPQ